MWCKEKVVNLIVKLYVLNSFSHYCVIFLLWFIVPCYSDLFLRLLSAYCFVILLRVCMLRGISTTLPPHSSLNLKFALPPKLSTDQIDTNPMSNPHPIFGYGLFSGAIPGKIRRLLLPEIQDGGRKNGSGDIF